MPGTRFRNRRWLALTGLVVCLVASGGCLAEPLEFTEVKRVDEKITRPELDAFLRIVKSLPDKKLPALPPVFALPPDWDSSRTLSVSDLVAEEKNLLEDRTSVEWMAKQLRRTRSLQRALHREEMTAEQFVGLSVALGVAMSRSTIRENQDLERIISQGEKEIKMLERDERAFSELGLEEMHSVLQKALWIAKVNRADRVRAVPPENVALVSANREFLSRLFPQEFQENPLDAVTDRLEEQGLPFEELPEVGSDEDIEWDPQTAIRGVPQSAVQTQASAPDAAMEIER